MGHNHPPEHAENTMSEESDPADSNPTPEHQLYHWPPLLDFRKTRRATIRIPTPNGEYPTDSCPRCKRIGRLIEAAMHVTGNFEGPIDLKECPVYSVLGEELHSEKYVIRVELSSLDEVTFQIEQTLRLEDRSAWTLEGHANSLLFEMNVGKYNQTDIGKECPSCDGMKNYWHSLKDRPNFTEQPLLLRWDWCQNTWRMSFLGSDRKSVV